MTQVQLLAMANFNEWQTAKAEQARKLIEQAINTDGFQRAVLDAVFLDTRLEKSNGEVVPRLTNAQILATILEGRERGSVVDGIVGLRVELYYKLLSSVIGHYDPPTIYTNTRFFNPSDPIHIAGHWMHEWLHAAGFLHDYDRSTRRPQSVPYLVGELVEAHAQQFVPLLPAL